MKWDAPNDYHDEIAMYDFVIKRLPVIIRMMNDWESELPNMKRSLLVRYEDLRENPEQQLSEILKFTNIQVQPSLLQETTEYAAFSNMKKRAANQDIRDNAQRLAATNPDNQDSAKIRRGKVGGFRDYFTDEQIIEIDTIVNNSLSNAFGYSSV